jgi:DNA-binding beta-propeller fold protein YncE
MKTSLTLVAVLRVCLATIGGLAAAALVATAWYEMRLQRPLSLAFSRDGRQLLVAYGGAGLRLWNLSEDRPRPIPVPLVEDGTYWTSPYEVRFAGPGLLTAYQRSRSREIPDAVVQWVIGEIRPLRLVRLPYRAKDGTFHIAANAPVAVASAEQKAEPTLDVFDLETGILLGSLPESASVPGGLRNQFAISSNGRRVVASHLGFGGPVVLKVWDTASRTLLRSFPIESGYGLAISPDGNLLVDEGNTVWDLETGRRLTRLDRYRSTPRHAVFSADGKLLALAFSEGTVKLCDAATGRQLAEFSCGVARQSTMAFAPDGSVFAVGTGGALRLWDMASFQEKSPLQEDRRAFAMVAFTGIFLGWSMAWGIMSRIVLLRRTERGKNSSRDAARSPRLTTATRLVLAVSGVVTMASSLADIFTVIHCSLCTPVWFVYLGYYGVAAGSFAVTQALRRSSTWLRDAAFAQLPCFMNGHFLSPGLAAVVLGLTLWIRNGPPVPVTPPALANRDRLDP